MARRYAALGRSLLRKEAGISSHQILPPPPPPPPLDPPPSSGRAGRSGRAELSHKPRKRSTYGLQRDYKILERERKVSTALEDTTFRATLEDILQGQLDGRNRPTPPTRPSPDQWLSDVANRPPHRGPRQPVAAGGGGGGGGETVIPINDLRGTEGSKYTLAQRETRCKLAAVYRLADLFGWNRITHSHITATNPGDGEEAGYLVRALGLLYREVTASNLVCADLGGRVLDAGSTQLGLDRASWVLHSAIHGCRRDVRCTIHISNESTVAVSAMNCGLLPVSVEAIAIGKASYLDFLEIEREDMQDEIGLVLGMSKVLILRNHGAVAMGESVEEAFCVAHKLVRACNIQVATVPAGLANISQAPRDEGVWSKCGGKLQRALKQGRVTWGPGEMDFEALMRMLDSKGYRTGYTYRGLELLQPGKSGENGDQEKKDSSDLEVELRERQTRATPKSSWTKRSLSPVVEKEPWEYLEEERKTELPKQPSKRLLARTPESGNTLSPVGDDPTHDDPTSPSAGLQSLTATAKQVARSTGDSFKKLENRETADPDPLLMASHTAQRVARSTKDSLQKLEAGQGSEAPRLSPVLPNRDVVRLGRDTPATPKQELVVVGGGGAEEEEEGEEEGEGDLLEVTKRTAERVARSTGHVASKIPPGTREEGEEEEEEEDLRHREHHHLGPLERMQETAKHVAESTGNAVWTLAQDTTTGEGDGERDREESGDDPAHLQQHDSFLNSTVESALPSSPILPLPPPRVMPRINGFSEPVPANHPKMPNGIRKLPVPHSIPIHLPNSSAYDTNTRILPPLPHTLSPHAPAQVSNDSVRTLPPVPAPQHVPTSAAQGHRELDGPRSSLLLPPAPRQDLKRPTVPRSLDSDSEYSTTESAELSQPSLQLPLPPYLRASAHPADSHRDLETNPSKNMVHTAQMVAESTGKAMHKLTTTLPH